MKKKLKYYKKKYIDLTESLAKILCLWSYQPGDDLEKDPEEHMNFHRKRLMDKIDEDKIIQASLQEGFNRLRNKK